MAIVKTASKLIVRNSGHYKYSGPVLTLGVPEFYLTEKELEGCLPTPRAAGPQRSPDLSTHPIGRRLGWVSARSFLDALGLNDWTSIDIPGCEHAPDLVHDLNTPFPASLEDRFGVILDPGTTEHVFDMHAALGNIVRALRVGGVVIHQVPIYMYNGGYYSLNPILLRDYYEQNGFGEVRAYVIMWDRYRAYTGKHVYYEYDPRILDERHALAHRDQCRYSPLFLFFARKLEARDELRKPVQSYEALVESMTAAPKTPAARLRSSLSSALFAALPWGAAFFLESVYRRQRARARLAPYRRRG